MSYDGWPLSLTFFPLSRMKSIVISSTLAVIGCVALSIAVALLAASPTLKDDGTQLSSGAHAKHAGSE